MPKIKLSLIAIIENIFPRDLFAHSIKNFSKYSFNINHNSVSTQSVNKSFTDGNNVFENEDQCVYCVVVGTVTVECVG